ncbi:MULTISPECIES: radical SAM protein [unclassified Leptolyngbya]|uniref:radical SAM protein n=1 Tax=unclassified Leptolyngbya TaxID=2650499 RepID=UPI001689BA6E|nr:MULTISPECIES: radical SAM protein [unclassified Leptolyngbya]MBD1910448.1 radical SAM protein [Leptolyngbya sp. FACHB-8]MBD2154217.1 radical SAM protein [Leptolyngbya sp. FACHB-16]
MPTRPYTFYALTNSLCSKCLSKVEAKIIFQDEQVYLVKHCPEHGREDVLIADDAEYYRQIQAFLKPGDMPLRFNTPIKHGCPYDCGLCPDHEQHSCLTLVELTDRCNLTCPICYADSGVDEVNSAHQPRRHRNLAEIERMLDAVVANEGEPQVVQLSGGEPTLHPDFFAVMDLVKDRPIKHLMINTNGLRIAQDREFCDRLRQYQPGIEIYLQFDSFEAEALRELRGADLRNVRQQAIAHLNEFNLSTTLVVTLKKGLNDHEIGKIIDFALKQRCVRGVTFQPIQIAGRLEGFDPKRDRYTLTEVRRAILEQSPHFKPQDILPVPCHPDSLAMAYALKLGSKVIPLTGMFSTPTFVDMMPNSVLYEQHPDLKQRIFELFSTSHSPASATTSLQQLLCCLPKVAVPAGLTYENIFRIMIVQFLDAYNFDVRSVKRSCIHIAHPDGRLIPFDTYNLFYREGSAGYEKVIQMQKAH